MKTIKTTSLLFLILLMSCNNKQSVTSKEDYWTYLEADVSQSLETEVTDLKFWEDKLEKNSNQYPYLAKLAGVNTNLFELTGNVDYLKKSEELLLEVNSVTNSSQASYLRSLASNYIKQHKFKEALEALTKAEKIGENRENTNKMLFDVHLELGNYLQAQHYLKTFKNNNDFDYLIRYAKWLDHEGLLEEAIEHLEKAKTIAESSNLTYLKLWAYTNLGDFYGHSGDITTSYNYYLKALELDQNNFYALKGIAWILYSHEDKPEEAIAILQKLINNHNTPDYHLLISEIANNEGNEILSKKHLSSYFEQLENPNYGDMYNKYNALIYTDDLVDLDKAFQIANREIHNRPTPQSYDLLAWTYYKKGDVKKALKVLEEHVVGHTFEPNILYHIAEVYKANGKLKEAQNLKKELLSSLYELGPSMTESILNL